jgi:uracil DNA glycosylase
MVSGDILYWASEGILMLNATFTTQILKSGRHFELWKPLMFRVFEILKERTDLIYLVFGESPYTQLIKGEIVQVDMLPKERNQSWDSGNMYDKINTLLTQKNKSKIIW